MMAMEIQVTWKGEKSTRCVKNNTETSKINWCGYSFFISNGQNRIFKKKNVWICCSYFQYFWKKTCSNVLYESIATIIPRWMGSLYLTSFISITLYNLVFFCTPKLQRSPLMCFYTYFIQNAFLNTAIQYCNNLIQNTVKNKRLALYWLIEENSQKKSFVLLCIFLYKEDMIMRLMWFGFVSKFRI